MTQTRKSVLILEACLLTAKEVEERERNENEQNQVEFRSQMLGGVDNFNVFFAKEALEHQPS